MPKMKTNSGAKKDSLLPEQVKSKENYAFKSHILTKKTTKQKRNLTLHRFGCQCGRKLTFKLVAWFEVIFFN